MGSWSHSVAKPEPSFIGRSRCLTICQEQFDICTRPQFYITNCYFLVVPPLKKLPRLVTKKFRIVIILYLLPVLQLKPTWKGSDPDPQHLFYPHGAKLQSAGILAIPPSLCVRAAGPWVKLAASETFCPASRNGLPLDKSTGKVKKILFSSVLWIRIHWIWIRIQNFWPNWDPDLGLCYQFWKKFKKIILEKNNFL